MQHPAIGRVRSISTKNLPDRATIPVLHRNGFTRMKHAFLSRPLAFCLALTLSTAAALDFARAAQDHPGVESLEQQGLGVPQSLTGTITDIITSAGISYVEVDTGKAKVWAAGKLDDLLDTGDTVSFSTDMTMRSFYSKSLDRNFDVIYFVKEFVKDDAASARTGSTPQAVRPQPNKPVAPAPASNPAEVAEGSLLRAASLDGLNTGDRPLSDYRGRPLIINVWASWCGPCRAEMGSLERLAQRYNGEAFNIIGISIDDYRNRATAFIDQAELSFANYIDHNLFMETMLGATTIPLTVLVDADGRVLMKVRGPREWDSKETVKAIGNVFGLELM